MARNGIRLLRGGLGIIFLWFRALKFFPGLSPAQTLAGTTVSVLSFGVLAPETAVVILAVRTERIDADNGIDEFALAPQHVARPLGLRASCSRRIDNRPVFADTWEVH